jgi:hypothetical protein
MLRKAYVLAAIVLVVAGCGAAEEPAEPETAPPRETVFDPLTSTIDRAEGVQQTVDTQAAEQRRRVEEAER